MLTLNEDTVLWPERTVVPQAMGPSAVGVPYSAFPGKFGGTVGAVIGGAVVPGTAGGVVDGGSVVGVLRPHVHV